MTGPADIEEGLIVTPRACKSEKSPGSSKRKVTPSSELSSPSKSFILSPRGAFPSERTVLRLGDSPLFEPSKRLFPSGEALISKFSSNLPFKSSTYCVLDERSPLKTTHAHPESPESSLPEIQIPPSRHLILPFNLRQNRKAFATKDSGLLLHLFPDTKAVNFDGYFLVFWLGTLPPKPWPVTIAGVQPYFTIDPNDDGPIPPIKRPSKSRLRVSAEINAINLPPTRIDDAFELVFDFFAKSETSITEVQYWKNFFVIVLENEDTDLTEVPSAIGRCNCFYLFEKEMGRPKLNEFPARRIRDPTGDVVDDSKYDILRPGVMLSSARHDTTHLEYRTTSGVLVEDCLGERYMTVASHGFPNGDKVFHPCSMGKEVGQIIMEISHTDVALVKLHDKVHFVNETFESPLDGATPTQLKEFIPVDETQIGSNIYMNSPLLGYSEGTCGPHSRIRVPSDDPNEPELVWIKARWLYLGQGSVDHLEDGVRGSVIWNDDGNVIGFFRYAPRSGHYMDWCLTVASDNVIERGYKIAG